METIRLNIGGMTCGGCANSVAKVLQGIDGVDSAEVDLASASAQVRFDPARVQVAAMLEAVEDAGFDASAS